MSIRLKFVLALLLTSLVAVAVVGGVAYTHMDRKVDLLRRQQAASNFREDVTAFLTREGDWAPGSDIAFRRFMNERRRQADAQPPGPPPPDAGREGPPRDGPPGPPAREGGEPPYHFILTDAQYHVLLGAGRYQHGELLPKADRADALPIEVNGQTKAYMSLQGVLTPSKQEQAFLANLREALLIGALAAAVLAVLLGWLLGSGLSRTLRQLTAAARAMHGGELRQQVAVHGHDEVAVLARSFNQMSQALAHSHESLKASHQKILEQANQLREMSIRDALTELYNRRHLDEQAAGLFEQSRRYGRPMTVVIGDIDFFKRINDQFSHATGDAVLRQVSEILRSHIRLSDLVARYGGEEFVIALPETSLPQAAALCDKLRDMIERFPWQQVHPDLKVTMSMGLCGDVAAGTVEAMLQRADQLLYRAKESGRNRVCFA